jgi:threonine 3-dehydrogenase
MPTPLMQAVVKVDSGPGVELREVPVPEVGPHDVLVRVRMASICGTDLHIYNWDEWSSQRIRPPVILGHEFSGVVEKVGSDVQSVSEGAHVSAEMHLSCTRCFQCRTGQGHVCREVRIIGVDCDGCFAEYVRIPESNVWSIDPLIPLEFAALFDPLGNAVHATLASEIAGRSVAVMGCGPVGILAVGVARACGAGPIFATEIHPFRRAVAETMGATKTFDPHEGDPVDSIISETHGLGVDVVLEMSGNADAARQAFRLVRRGGRVSLLGIPSRPVTLDLARDLILKGVTAQGIHGRRVFNTWFQMQSLLKSGSINLSPVITHKMPMADIDRGMDFLVSGSACKILLYPNAFLTTDC